MDNDETIYTTETQAQAIAKRIQPRAWYVLADTLEAESESVEQDWSSETTRYIFADGSEIVASGDTYDVI